MRRNKRREAFSKEKIIMAASTVLVLGTLTVTGLWMGARNNQEDDGYVVDLSAIEQDITTGLAEKNDIQFADNVTQDTARENAPTDDLDYDPFFQETNSGHVENPDVSDSESMSEGAEESGTKESAAATASDQETKQKESGNEAEGESDQEGQEALSTAMQPALTFQDGDTLVWPISGNILVNFSMDKTIYFPTLDQYKYNPAIVIEAHEGDLITAAAAGKVTSVFADREIGNAVTMELGNGYEVTYGQLANILVSEGSYVDKGDVIAQVAAPTRYYSVEGTNVYFKLTKDGTPVNPMEKLN